MLSPFTKKSLNIKLIGVTNSPDEPSVDAMRACWLPVLAKFVRNDEEKAAIKVREQIIVSISVFRLLDEDSCPMAADRLHLLRRIANNCNRFR